MNKAKSVIVLLILSYTIIFIMSYTYAIQNNTIDEGNTIEDINIVNEVNNINDTNMVNDVNNINDVRIINEANNINDSNIVNEGNTINTVNSLINASLNDVNTSVEPDISANIIETEKIDNSVSTNAIPIDDKIQENVPNTSSTNEEQSDKLNKQLEVNQDSENKNIMDNLEIRKKTKSINSTNINIEEGVYIISSALDSSKVIDISRGSSDNKANVQIWKSDRVDQQKFLIKKLNGDYYNLISIKSSKVLDVENASKNEGANVWQFESNGTDAQQWLIKDCGDGYCSFVSKCNGLYLNVSKDNPINGTNVNVIKGNNSNSQKFILNKAEEFWGKQTLNNGVYTIRTSLNSNKVLDVSQASTLSGANIQLWEDVNVGQQRFIIEYKGNGFYTIESFKSGKVLDVEGANTKNTTNVWQHEKNGTNAQKWVIYDCGDGYYNIISRCGGLYLNVSGSKTNNGANIEMYEKKDSNAQKFKIEQSAIGGTQTIDNGTYQIVTSLNEKKVLDVSGASIKSEANIQLWENENVSQQKFRITYLNNGLYSIICEKSNKVLDVKGAGTKNGTNVWQYESNGTNAQQWVIKDLGDGYYSFISRCNDLYLNVANNTPSNGTNVQVNAYTNSQSQKFKISKTNPKGIDVSVYQGNIDWSSVKKDGVDFAMIRVGYRGYETGKIVQDSKYNINITNATTNGIKCGVYFVTQAMNYNEGVEEANWVINTISKDKSKIKCPITIDVEWAGGDLGNNGRADSISVEERTQAIKGFCETIKSAGYTPMIYANKDWLTRYIDLSKLSDYKVWLAHYVSGAPIKKSNYTGAYEYWQYTSTGNVSRNNWLCRC